MSKYTYPRTYDADAYWRWVALYMEVDQKPDQGKRE